MHHGTCATHVPWCMSGLLNRGGGENVLGIPGACATHNFMYLAIGSYSVRKPAMAAGRNHYIDFACVERMGPVCYVFMMISSNGNISRLTSHLCGEFTGHQPLRQYWFFYFRIPCSSSLSCYLCRAQNTISFRIVWCSLMSLMKGIPCVGVKFYCDVIAENSYCRMRECLCR